MSVENLWLGLAHSMVMGWLGVEIIVSSRDAFVTTTRLLYFVTKPFAVKLSEKAEFKQEVSVM